MIQDTALMSSTLQTPGPVSANFRQLTFRRAWALVMSGATEYTPSRHAYSKASNLDRHFYSLQTLLFHCHDDHSALIKSTFGPVSRQLAAFPDRPTVTEYVPHGPARTFKDLRIWKDIFLDSRHCRLTAGFAVSIATACKLH